MLFSIDGTEMQTVPARRRKDFDTWKDRLEDDEYKAVQHEINRLIDEGEGKDVVVSSFLPGKDWIGTVFEPLYHACKKNVEVSGWFFGLIVWQTMIERDDKWFFMKTEMPDRDILGMTYFKPSKR